jgi:lysine-N-methylase
VTSLSFDLFADAAEAQCLTAEEHLVRTRLVRPEYAEKFRCIGPSCEDSCCVGWNVDIDKSTFRKYHSISPGPLRVLIDESIVRNSDGSGGENPSKFAHIKMLPSTACPFHNGERLCQIQVELGEKYLSRTCATYPRQTHSVDNLADRTLALSCPEASRLVLLSPDLLASDETSIRHMTWDDSKSNSVLLTYFWPIREFVIGLIRNRVYPLWQRLFLLGTFSRRLEAVVRGEVKGGFPVMLKSFTAAVASETLRPSIETIPADLTLQLGMVLELVKLRHDNALQAPRFVECIDDFARGVGYGPGSTLESMCVEYRASYENYFAPFFDEHPYILENYLINLIFHRLFPFGAKLFDRAAVPEPAKEFALLATDFALIKGLLIGVSGGQKESFSSEHIVHTVQTAAKHFEHNPQFLLNAHHILESLKLDNAHGLTMLLRN